MELYKSSLKESLFYPPDHVLDRKNDSWDTKYYLIFVGFDSPEELEDFCMGNSKHSFEMADGNHTDTVIKTLAAYPNRTFCCFLKSSTRKMLILRMGNEVIQSYLAYPDNHKKRAENIAEIGNQMDTGATTTNFLNYNYTSEDVLATIKDIIKSEKDEPGKDKSVKSRLYHSNFERLMKITGTPNDEVTKNAIRSLCSTLARIDHEILEVYNKQPDIQNNTYWFKPGDKLSAEAIIKMNIRLQQLERQIKKFKNSDFVSAQELVDLVKNILTNDDDEWDLTKHIISYPFFSLSLKKREEMILLLLDGDKLNGKERKILFVLLYACSVKERFDLITKLNAADKIFEIMTEASGSNRFLFETMLLIGITATMTPQNDLAMRPLNDIEQGVIASEAMLAGNYIFYSNKTSKIHSYDLNVGVKKLSLTNEGTQSSDFDIMPGPLSFGYSDSEATSDDQKKYLDHFASAKTLFDPLEMIVLTAENKINSDVLPLEKDQSVVMPACIVYLLFKEKSIKESAYALMLGISLILLPLGVAGLVAAISTSTTLGIVISVVDLSADALLLTVNHPDFENNNPEITKTVNSVAFIYGMLRLPAAVRGLWVLGKNINRNFREAIKAFRIKRILLLDDELKSTKVSAKKSVYRQFVKQFGTKRIQELTKEQILKHLVGHTAQANKIAKLIEENRMKIKIVSDKRFELLLKEKGIKDFADWGAFTEKNISYFRSSTPFEKFMSEIVHEGTHVDYYLNNLVFDTLPEELRCFFYEHQFQKAVGAAVEFKTVAEIKENIRNLYKY